MLTFVDLVGPRTGGAITVAKNLLCFLAQSRPDWYFKVYLMPESMCFFQTVNFQNMDFIPVRNTQNRLARIRWQQWKLPKLAYQHKASVIFSLVNIGPSYSKTPTVVYFHQALLFFSEEGMFDTGMKVKVSVSRYLKKRFALSGFRRAKKIIVQTHAMRDKIISETHIRPDIIVPIHTGCPISGGMSKQQRVITDEMVERIKKMSSPVAIYLSYPAFHKNFNVIFGAAEKMRQQGITGSFVLTLDKDRFGDKKYHHLVNRYLIEIRKRNVEDRVHFLGSIPSDGVSTVLRSCQALVFPSLVESFPQPLVEAMSVGLPILAADRPYAREIVGQSGLFFDPLDNGTMLSKAMKKLSVNSMSKELSDRSSSRMQNFSYQKAAMSISEILWAAASHNHNRD